MWPVVSCREWPTLGVRFQISVVQLFLSYLRCPPQAQRRRLAKLLLLQEDPSLAPGWLSRLGGGVFMGSSLRQRHQPRRSGLRKEGKEPPRIG